MNHSDSIALLASALCKAEAELKSAPFDRKNPFLQNRPYASLASHIDTARPVLAKYDLAITQLVTSDGGNIGVETVLMHKSGEWISGLVTIEPEEERGKSFAQVAGSIISYFRRYSLAAILNMYSDEDNDGAGQASRDKEQTEEKAQASGTNGKSDHAEQPATPQDGDEPAPATWEGVEMYRSLYAEAIKLGLKADAITPGKTTKGQVRALYAELDAQVKAKKNEKV